MNVLHERMEACAEADLCSSGIFGFHEEPQFQAENDVVSLFSKQLKLGTAKSFA